MRLDDQVLYCTSVPTFDDFGGAGQVLVQSHADDTLLEAREAAEGLDSAFKELSTCT